MVRLVGLMSLNIRLNPVPSISLKYDIGTKIR